MPSVTGVITAGSADVPVETIRTLQTELAAVGLPVVGAEADGTPRFGTDTQARVREFQQRYGRRETGDVDAGTGGVMSLAALVATESDRSQLRERLKSALNNVPDFIRVELLARATRFSPATRLRAPLFTFVRLRDFPGQSTIIHPDAQPTTAGSAVCREPR